MADVNSSLLLPHFPLLVTRSTYRDSCYVQQFQETNTLELRKGFDTSVGRKRIQPVSLNLKIIER